MDLFKPTFGDTQSFEIIKDFTDAIVIGLQYMDKVFAKQRNIEVVEAVDTIQEPGLQAVSNVFHNAATVFNEAMDKDTSLDAFSM